MNNVVKEKNLHMSARESEENAPSSTDSEIRAQ
jgi:hypothetical protein